MADVANGAWYAADGDWLDAGLSFAGAIPVIGDAALGARYAIKGAKYAKEGLEAADDVYHLAQAAKADVAQARADATAQATAEENAPAAVAGGGPAPTRVFWSGGNVAKSAATDWAVANGGETIGTTARGKALEALTSGMDWSKARALWDAASRDFAEGAAGEVHVFQSAAGVGVKSIWATTEYPTLLNNSNVTNIIYHVVG